MSFELIPILAELHGNLSFGVAAAGAGIGVGSVGLGAALAVGRNPGAFGKILTISLIGMALAEAIAIYGLVLALTGLDTSTALDKVNAAKTPPAQEAPATE